VDAAKMTINTAGTDYVLSSLVDTNTDYTGYAIVANQDNNTVSATEPYIFSNNGTSGQGHGVSMYLGNSGTAAAITTIVRSGNVVTVTFPSTSGAYTVGQWAVIVGVTTDPTLNGSQYVLSYSYSGGVGTLTYYSPGSNVSIGSTGSPQGTIVPPSVGVVSQNYVNISGTNTVERTSAATTGGNSAMFVATTFQVSTGTLTSYNLTTGVTSTPNVSANPRLLMTTPFCFGGNPLGSGGKSIFWMGGFAQSLHTPTEISANYNWWKNLIANQAIGSITISANTMAVLALPTGVIVPGQMVIGAQTGTQVLQQISGTPGGVGQYYVNIAQTIATALTVQFGQLI
jgi:hypothetical protein